MHRAVAAQRGDRLFVCVGCVIDSKHKKIRIFGIFHEIFAKNTEKFKKISKNALTNHIFML